MTRHPVGPSIAPTPRTYPRSPARGASPVWLAALTLLIAACNTSPRGADLAPDVVAQTSPSEQASPLWSDQGSDRPGDQWAAKDKAKAPAISTPEVPPHAGNTAEIMTPRDISDLRALQSQVKEVRARAMPAVVGVEVGGAFGSGVIVSAQGEVLTAGHVARQPGAPATLFLADGRRVRGESMGIHHGLDAGMIRITEKGEYPFLPLGKSADLRRGQWTLALGHPGGFRRDRPAVLRLGRLIFSNEQVVRTDNTLVGGDSGGPLLDLEGRVVGIHSRIGRSITANLHVPIDVFIAHADRFRNGDNWGLPLGDAGGPFLGIAGEDHPQGVRITQVIEGQAAAQAGLRVGDLVTQFEGKPAKSYRDMVLAIQTKKPGEKIKLRVERGKENLDIEATLGKRPEP